MPTTNVPLPMFFLSANTRLQHGIVSFLYKSYKGWNLLTSSRNILFLPFRRTQHVTLSDAIRKYISNKYDEHPDMFTEDLHEIDSLRADAVNTLEAHVSGIKKLSKYAAQLVFMGGKFPIDVGVDFTWYPALGFNTQHPVSESNIRYELANILFNLASLYSQLACSVNRSTSDGLKAACNYFCQAAGVIAHLKEKIIPEIRLVPPEDMDLMTLESLQHLLLAQAQECFWAKAVKDELKDGLISKLAAKVSDFYDQAAEFGTKSDAISTDWIHHMTAKHHHFAAAAQYRASRECLEKQRYGEEVARLRDSLACVNEGLKESRWINRIVLGDLNGLKSKVSDDLRRAEKDNDVIYLMNVPPKSELKTLDRAGMATPRAPVEVTDPLSMLGEKGAYGQPLFARLVPYAVHFAATIYAERRNRLVNTQIFDQLEALTTQAREVLQSLNLPGSLQALDKPLGVPGTLVHNAEDIRQAEGLHRIRRTMRETSRIREEDMSLYQSGCKALQTEAVEDERARTKYGTDRWSREPSTQAAQQHHNRASEIDAWLKSAQGSDELVASKVKEQEHILIILSSTKREIEDYIPSARIVTIPPDIQDAADDVRNILSRLSLMESDRKKFIESLRLKVKRDEIDSALLIETARLERDFPMQRVEAVQFEPLFEERLHYYDADREKVQKEKETHNETIEHLKRANTTYFAAKGGSSGAGLVSKEREEALQRLNVGIMKYKEIVKNLSASRKFYGDLQGIVSKFAEECKQFAYSRRMEARSMEQELMTSQMAGMRVKPHEESGVVLSPQQQQQQTQRKVTRQQQQRFEQHQHPVSRQEEQIQQQADYTYQAPLSQQSTWRQENVPPSFGNAPPTKEDRGSRGPAAGSPLAAPTPNKPLRMPSPNLGIWDPSHGIKFG